MKSHRHAGIKQILTTAPEVGNKVVKVAVTESILEGDDKTMNDVDAGWGDVLKTFRVVSSRYKAGWLTSKNKEGMASSGSQRRFADKLRAARNQPLETPPEVSPR